jgi:hypothetical protein
MESFLDFVFPFLIIAFVGLRIASALLRRKRSASRKENAPAGAAPSRAARGFVPWEDDSRDDTPTRAEAAVKRDPVHTTADDDEDFSAWNLSVDDEPPAPAAPPKVREAFPLGALIAASAPAPLVVAPESVAPPSRRVDPGCHVEQRFRGLSPLQQGVVWAEILGVPRGLEA